MKSYNYVFVKVPNLNFLCGPAGTTEP